MSLIQELRKRNVFRVAAAYLVVAWLLLQLTDVVFENVNAPDWVMQVIMLLLAIGFPVALLLAWAFDLTPDGIKRDPSDIDAETGRAKSIPWVPVFVVGLLAVAAVFFVTRSADETQVSSTETTDERVLDSVAVLPFEPFSDNKEDEYFADGLADTLLHKLSQLQTLKVIARNSSFQYKGSNLDVREIGAALDVATIVEGSVQRQGEQVRVIVQLIDTRDGEHIWSQTYDDAFANIFELQDRIAEAIARRLQISVSENDRLRMLRNGTSNTRAYDLLMQALNTNPEYSSTRYDPDDDPVIELIQQAIAEDESYSQAWAELSNQYNSIAFMGAAGGRYDEFVDLAMVAADKAVELDPEYEYGYVARGFAHWRRRDIEKMKTSLRKVLQINPNSSDGLSGMALALIGTDPDQAYEHLVRAHELDPESFIIFRQKYFALVGMNRHEDAMEQLYLAVEKFPDQDIYYLDIAGAQVQSFGRPDLALEWTVRLQERQPDSRFAIEVMVGLWLVVNDIERAEAWSLRLAREYPASVETSMRPARIEFIKGSVDDTTALLDDIELGPNNFFDLARLRSATCMTMEDHACVLAQADIMHAKIEQARAAGGRLPARMPISEVVTRATAQTKEERAASDAITGALRETRNWPVLALGSKNFQYTGYLRAMLLAQAGRPGDAMKELDRTLSIADGGIVGTDLAGLPPDVSPYFSVLREIPGFDDWFVSFNERRNAMHRRMVEIAEGI